MPYAAGNYRFKEFTAFGTPMKFWLYVTVIFIYTCTDRLGVVVGVLLGAAAVVVGGKALTCTALYPSAKVLML